MRKRVRRCLVATILVSILMLLAGCAGGQNKKADIYDVQGRPIREYLIEYAKERVKDYSSYPESVTFFKDDEWTISNDGLQYTIESKMNARNNKGEMVTSPFSVVAKFPDESYEKAELQKFIVSDIVIYER